MNYTTHIKVKLEDEHDRIYAITQCRVNDARSPEILLPPTVFLLEALAALLDFLNEI
jgi:hypothetical protein